MSHGPEAIQPCPLCSCPGHAVLTSISYGEIWQRLKDVWGVSISDESKRAQPTQSTLLVRCAECGLERFEPMSPGSPDFYRELMGAIPYNGQRWEFGLVKSELSGSQAVVDLGCGDGSFLLGLGSRAGRVVGIDHHRPTIERLRGQNIEAYTTAFSEFAEAEAQRFDVVTCFHVLEHVRDPVVTVAAARACLRPGGRLFLSVPNRERALRREDEPLDCPPHHVTRWSAAQFKVLAERTELQIERVRYEPPEFSVLRSLAQEAMGRRLGILPVRPRVFFSKAWGRVAVGPRRYARLVQSGRYVDVGVLGHSVLAEFTRPFESRRA